MVEFIGIYSDQSVIKVDNLQELYVHSISSLQSFHSDSLETKSIRNNFHRSKPFIVFNTKNSRISIHSYIINRPWRSIKVYSIAFLMEIKISSRLVSIARQLLLNLFQCLFPNDALICEYLLLHLISRTYVRQASTVYGKLALNLSHLSSEQFHALEQIFQLILPLYSNLVININTLNTMQLMPNKSVGKDEDNEARLMQTPLQLPFNSHLLIDERNMECGQLTTLGTAFLSLSLSLNFLLRRFE